MIQEGKCCISLILNSYYAIGIWKLVENWFAYICWNHVVLATSFPRGIIYVVLATSFPPGIIHVILAMSFLRGRNHMILPTSFPCGRNHMILPTSFPCKNCMHMHGEIMWFWSHLFHMAKFTSSCFANSINFPCGFYVRKSLVFHVISNNFAHWVTILTETLYLL